MTTCIAKLAAAAARNDAEAIDALIAALEAPPTLDAVTAEDLSQLTARAAASGIDQDIDALIAAMDQGLKLPEAPEIKVSLADAEGTMKTLMAYHDALPEAERRVAALYLHAAGRYIQQSPAERTAALQELGREFTSRYVFDADAGGKYLARFREAGKDALGVAAEVEAADKAVAANKARAQEIIAAGDAKLQLHIQVFQPRLDEMQQEMQAEWERAKRTGDWTRAKDLDERYNALSEEMSKALTPEKEAALRELEANRAIVADAYKSIGNKFIAGLLESSPVTAEAAAAWAAAQEITPNARARLKANRYPVEQVRKDMAEFYRLTCGRLGSVTLTSARKHRASASEIHGHGSSIIKMGRDFNKRVLWHEMGHHLEADPVILAAAQSFLKARATSGPKRLNKIQPGVNYKAHEIAVEGTFFDPYVGKIYDNATEVLSMGVESFSNPELLPQRMAKDPDHFAFILGALRTPPAPLFGAVKALRQQAASAIQAREDAKADEWEMLLSQYVKDVSLDPNDTLGLDLRTLWGFGTQKILGSWQQVLFVECSAMRNPKTKRKGRGIAVYFTRNDTSAQRTVVSSMHESFDGLDYAKAIAKARGSRTWLQRGDVELLKRLINGT